MSIADTWGTSADERILAFASDRFVDAPTDAWYRGVTVHAPAAVVFRWLCQFRAAPYSYDWIDNFGRRSPQQLTPGLEQLAVGQRVMSIFKLVDFEQNRQITLRTRGAKPFGAFAVTYMLVEQPDNSTRLLAKISMGRAHGIIGTTTRALMAWGDLIMMRRQFLNLKRLAEATHAAAAQGAVDKGSAPPWSA
jgi:hypothetical protein